MINLYLQTEPLTFLLVYVCSANGDIRHYQIKISDTGQFFLAEKHTFNSISDVIQYHEHNAAGTFTQTHCARYDRDDCAMCFI